MCVRFSVFLLLLGIIQGCTYPAIVDVPQEIEIYSDRLLEGERVILKKSDPMRSIVSRWFADNTEGWKSYVGTPPRGIYILSGDEFFLRVGEDWVILHHRWRGYFSGGTLLQKSDDYFYRVLECLRTHNQLKQLDAQARHCLER